MNGEPRIGWFGVQRTTEVKRKRWLLAAGVVALVVSGACKAPFGADDEPEASAGPRPELSEPAASLPAAEQPEATNTTTPAAGPSTTEAAPPATTEPPANTPTTEPGTTTVPPRHLLTIDDADGDAGLQTPGYADLVTATVLGTGSGLRVTVDMTADIPTSLEQGEVQGVGIDLFRSNPDESDYQVFLDGGSDGWRAYLQTPDGFVDYPGSFAIGGRRLAVEVPWSSVGGERGADVGVFSDWSAEATPLNRSGSDRAPDRGTTRFGT